MLGSWLLLCSLIIVVQGSLFAQEQISSSSSASSMPAWMAQQIAGVDEHQALDPENLHAMKLKQAQILLQYQKTEVGTLDAAYSALHQTLVYENKNYRGVDFDKFWLRYHSFISLIMDNVIRDSRLEYQDQRQIHKHLGQFFHFNPDDYDRDFEEPVAVDSDDDLDEDFGLHRLRNASPQTFEVNEQINMDGDTSQESMRNIGQFVIVGAEIPSRWQVVTSFAGNVTTADQQEKIYNISQARTVMIRRIRQHIDDHYETVKKRCMRQVIEPETQIVSQEVIQPGCCDLQIHNSCFIDCKKNELKTCINPFCKRSWNSRFYHEVELINPVLESNLVRDIACLICMQALKKESSLTKSTESGSVDDIKLPHKKRRKVKK